MMNILLRKMKLAQIAKASLIIKDSGIKGLNNKINSRRQWKKNSNVDTRVFENIEFKINSIDIVVDKDIDITNIMNKLEGLNVSYNLFYIMDKPKERGHYYGISELFLYQYFIQRSFVFITKRTIDFSFIILPFGFPVEPDVYIIYAKSSLFF